MFANFIGNYKSTQANKIAVKKVITHKLLLILFDSLDYFSQTNF